MVQPKTISVTDFKARCLALFEELDSAGIVVTKRGQPIARVLPVGPGNGEKLIGALKGQIEVLGDIESTGLSWDAESGHTHAGRRARRQRPRR